MTEYTGQVFRIMIWMGVGLFLFFYVLSSRRRKQAEDGTAKPSVPGADFIVYGATLLAEGDSEYSDWCWMMEREFGPSVTPDLPEYFRMAGLVRKYPHAQWGIQADRLMMIQQKRNAEA